MSALLQFKSSFIVTAEASRGPLAYPKTESWVLGNVNNGTSSNCCLWDGVQCEEITGCVIALDLSSSFLYGSINSTSSLFRLVHLQRINLANNHFNYSRIPTEFGLFSGSTHLNLSFSGFSGPIPLEISKLSRLVSLDLCSNVYPNSTGLLQLQGQGFTSLVENLTLLEDLFLEYVNISSLVPERLANLYSLRTLRLAQTGLYGEFPAGVFQLPKLEIIGLSFNNITGHLPKFNSTSPLRILDLAVTKFSGELPVSLGDLSSLIYLRLNSYGCNFSGSIPNSIGNLQSLKYLDIAGCQFSGSIPSSFSNLSELMYLDVEMNSFRAQTLDSLSWLWKLTKLTTLGLPLINLQGEIPSSIGNLSQLVTLSLIGNELKGQIPPQLMNLTQLSKLFLRTNQLSGHIPNGLMNMTQLTVLDLCTNKLEGPIPATISQLQNLQVLRLIGNNLIGTLDFDTFLPLKNLVVIQLSMNKLSLITRDGTNSRLPQLQALGLAGCNLTEFPSFLKNQEVMDWLDLSNNKISGEIPNWVWNMSVNNLEFMNLSYNFLTGFDRRPAVLPWKYLVTLDLTSNLLEGHVPIPQPWIRSYLVSNNKLTGNFSASICNLSSLVILDLSFNFLGGELPQCLGNISNSLLLLNLQSNRFHGTVPQFHAIGMQLRMISLAENHFQGKLPRSLTNCPDLQFINFGINQFNDTFPSWLESLPELRVLILRANQFHGSIGKPSSNPAFQKLRIIDLSHNSFSGELPRDYFRSWKEMKVVNTTLGKLSYMNQSLQVANYLEYTYFGNYEYSMTIITKSLELYYPKISEDIKAMDFSWNMFEGEIPDTIGELKELHLLNLSSNFLTGQIPTSLGNLGALESLDLSQNRLSGEIPQELLRLNFLAVLDVSYNNLTGPIPRGQQFNTFPKSAYEGNEGLCGDVISRRCGGLDTEPAGKTGTSGKEQGSDSWYELDWKIVVIGYGGGLVVGVLIGSVFISDEHGWFAAVIVRVQEHRRRRRKSRKRRLNRRN
ncbi:hypothetical protein CDL15_Pgr021615 [Punica granatum]|nr:hypothetical protein CDL15_Pgr021615 [Punica granatum]PKI35550.1 hypothetical protein CRG98_044004 [Punica granatum]